jgi:hypothetical protein
VINDELTPIPSANGGIPSLGLEATANASGVFIINGVPAGTYTVYVQRLGYEASASTVTIRVGEVTEHTFRLTPLAVGDPRTVLVIADGMIACGASTIVITVTTGCNDPNHKSNVYFNVTSGIRATMTETTWDSTSVLTGKELLNNHFVDGKGRGSASGVSPLKLVDEAYGSVTKSLVVREQYFVNFATTSNPLVVAYQQRFKVHYSAFYDQDIPAGYSAIQDA